MLNLPAPSGMSMSGSRVYPLPASLARYPTYQREGLEDELECPLHATAPGRVGDDSELAVRHIDAHRIVPAVMVEQIVDFPPEIQIRFFVHIDAPRDGDIIPIERKESAGAVVDWSVAKRIGGGIGSPGEGRR